MGKFYGWVCDELSLYVRQAAWLNTIPVYPPAQGKKITGNAQLSRREQFAKAGIEEPEMPICPLYYLVGYLFEIGPLQSGGMADAPLSHGEIAAWQHNTGIVLNSWETRILKRLSKDYLITSRTATAPDCPAPWQDAPEVQAAMTAQRLKASIREMIKS